MRRLSWASVAFFSERSCVAFSISAARRWLKARICASAWDSRCDEGLFSNSEWTMKQYYRVGQNKYISVLAFLEGAQTSSP